jgi:exodeoxyribonuclease VII small subunit
MKEEIGFGDDLAEDDAGFEEALKRLEEVVERLERGDSLTLEESLGAFEEGIRLTRICRKKLDDAQLRVEQLIEVDEDEVSTVPFEGQEEYDTGG